MTRIQAASLTRHAGPAAAAFLLLALALFAADGLQIEAAEVRDYSYDSATLPDRHVKVHQQSAAPGDVVKVYPTQPTAGPFSSSDFFIVEAGQGGAYLNGSTADTVYVASIGHESDACCGPAIHFTRPTVTPPSAAIDLVWVYHFAPGVERPASGQEQEYFDNWVGLGTTADRPTVVVRAWGVTAHAWLSGIGWASTLAGAVALLAWIRNDTAPPVGAASQAGLVDLAQVGKQYLQRLAWLLAILLLPLVAAGWIGEAFGYAFLQELAGPGPAWQDRLLWGFRIVWLATAVAWSFQLWRVLHRLRVWTTARPDIGL